MFEYTTTCTHPIGFFTYVYVEDCKQIIETEYIDNYESI